MGKEVRFDIGQEVIVKEALGERPQTYYHGETLNDLPLGTRARIIAVRNQNIIYLRLRNGKEFAVRGGEIRLIEGSKEKNHSREFGINLERVLIKEEEVEVGEDKDHEFRPKFNEREEFAIWVRSEFPDLERYTIMRGEQYPELENRKYEVLCAAISACNHGMKTTNHCVYRYFSDFREHFLRGRADPDHLMSLVGLIERLSANLPIEGDRHYGTRIRKE